MSPAQFRDLVDAHADGLYRFALAILRDPVTSEDAVQDAFERFWRKRDEVEPSKHKSYLFSTLHNRCIDLLRQRKPTMELTAEHASVDARPNWDIQEQLHHALKRLDARQQSMILLRDYEGYSYVEIAEITGSSLDQVKVNLHRARRAMQQFIGSIENVL
ncbi:MAG: hypothetical protein RJA19_588 [Bacteroidota bacterium]|jgi:RNA polymerase sigma-70 factor (ECF subfamily)